MGTNYYFRPNDQSPLRVFEKIHIGKKSIGWQFFFMGYDVEGGARYVKVAPGLCLLVNLPECKIVSKNDWLTVLKHGNIVDEYGAACSYDEFKRIVAESGASHYDYLIKMNFSTKSDFKDSEGYSFSLHEFF